MTLYSNDGEETPLPVSMSIVCGHADIPHCDAPPSPEDQRFYDALDANEEYCQLAKKEKWEERALRDSHRVFGRSVYESVESGKATVNLPKLSRHQLKYIKQHLDTLKEIRGRKWKLYDEIRVQSSTPTARDEQ